MVVEDLRRQLVPVLSRRVGGVVDEHRRRAKVVSAAGDDLIGGSRVHQVGMHLGHVRAETAQLLGQRLRPIVIREDRDVPVVLLQVGEEDIVPAPGECPANRRADPDSPAGPGHDRDRPCL